MTPIDISDQARYRGGPLSSYDGFIFHHTGGRGTPQDVVNTLNQRGLGTQYVMDRDGTVYRTLPQGAKGAQIMPSPNTNLSNNNTEGMEIIAKDDTDLTPAQIASARQFGIDYAQQHPGVQFYGHGMVNPGHKEPTEGYTVTNEVRAALKQPTIGPGGVQLAAYTPGSTAATSSAPATEPDIPFTLPPNAPMGMRNNNPLNIKFRANSPFAGVVGPSQNTDQGDPQFVFQSHQHGMNAAYQLLSSKYAGGKITPNQIIAGQGGWTPGNFAAAGNVARNAGIGPDDDIRFSDPAHAKAFMRALLIQEQGEAGKAYPDAMIERAISGKPATGGQAGTVVAGAAGAGGEAPKGTQPAQPAAAMPGLIPLTPEQAFTSSIGQALASIGSSGALSGGGVSHPDPPPIRTPAMETPISTPNPMPPEFQPGGVSSQLASLVGSQQDISPPPGAPGLTDGAPSMTSLLPTVGTPDSYNYLDPRRTVSPSTSFRGVRLS